MKGFCRCGCGKKTPIATHTRKAIGHVKGKPIKVINGHQGRMNNNFRHGWYGTPEYRAWSGMFQRCTNPRNHKYEIYGARGITVCHRWSAFENFLKDAGMRPSKKHSLDRIDVNGNYEPKNCRWATRRQQVMNRRPFKMTIISRFSDKELLAEVKRRGL